jgi:hypothetical protein
MISVHWSPPGSQRGERDGMGVTAFWPSTGARRGSADHHRLDVSRGDLATTPPHLHQADRTEDRVQPGSGRAGVAQLIQLSEREDERLLDRIGGVFPAAKEMERVGVESGPVSDEQCAQGQAIGASCGVDKVGVRRMLIRRLVHHHVNKMRPQAKKYDGDVNQGPSAYPAILLRVQTIAEAPGFEPGRGLSPQPH